MIINILINTKVEINKQNCKCRESIGNEKRKLQLNDIKIYIFLLTMYVARFQMTPLMAVQTLMATKFLNSFLLTCSAFCLKNSVHAQSFRTYWEQENSWLEDLCQNNVISILGRSDVQYTCTPFPLCMLPKQLNR